MLDEAKQEVTREVDGFAVDADAPGHGMVDDGQRDRITDLPLQHLRARTYQHKRLHSYASVPANSAMEISVGQGINGPNRLGLAPILEMQATIAYMFWSQKIWHCQYLNTGTGLCKSQILVKRTRFYTFIVSFETPLSIQRRTKKFERISLNTTV